MPRSPRRIGSPTSTGFGRASRIGARHGSARPTWGCRSEPLVVRSDGGTLPAWFIPAHGGAPGPGVVLVHGWDSARDRTLPKALFLHAAGFHCLTFDVRGNGANPPEVLPVSTGEYGADAAAAFDALLARPEVTRGAILGHSMGGTGAILAAASDPRVAAVVSVSAPSDPRRMVRQTFRLAQLPLPGPIATPLSWLTTRVFVRPRGHALRAISARHAIARYAGPILGVHGRDDRIMPADHADRIVSAARMASAGSIILGRSHRAAHRPTTAVSQLASTRTSNTGEQSRDSGAKELAGYILPPRPRPTLGRRRRRPATAGT